MPRSKIPSPARSEGVKMTPRRHRFRSSRSVSSPARSDVSVKLSSIVQMHAMESPVLSPLRTRRSVLSDNTDIEVPRRQSWWRRLEENSRDVMEVFENKTIEQPDNIEEYIEADFKSQENDFTVDLPESSDGESVMSIILPKRKFFSQKQTQANDLFHKIIENRENFTQRKSKANTDNTIFVGKKNLFSKGTEETQTRPTFPAGLLNMTEDKTLMNKTHNITKHAQIRNLLGNRAGTKRKNMFAQFIMSESEDEIPDIQPNVTGFSKSKQQRQHKMSASQSTRNTSPTSNETDLEFDDWQHLPSSTMVDSEFGNIEDNSPVKRPRLSKPNSVVEDVQGNVRNKHNKNKQSNIVLHSPEDDNEAVINSNMKEYVSRSNSEKTLIQDAESDNLGQSGAEVIQVDSDDDNDFTLQYDNDDGNIQDNDEMDITVKESQKNSCTNEKNSSPTKKVLNSPSPLKGSETQATCNNNSQVISQSTSVGRLEESEGNKMINQDISKNVSWKAVAIHQEHHAALNVREDLFEQSVNNKTNTSISTTNRQDTCDEIDNRDISIASMDEAEKEAIVEKNKTDVVLQEKETSEINKVHHKLYEVETQQQIDKSFEEINKSSLINDMGVDDKENNDSKALNKNLEEVGNHNYEEKNRNHTDSSIETEINDIAGDVENIVNESAEKTDQNTTSSTQSNNEAKRQDTNEKNKLNESKIKALEETSITAIDEKNETICKDNHEEGSGARQSNEKNETRTQSNSESQQNSMSSNDENMDRGDVIGGESEIQNETNEETDKQTGISSMDVNVETEDEDDSDEERNEEIDDDNSAEEDEVSNENTDEFSNQVERSTNRSIETEDEDGENNEEDDDEHNAEENEINESNEETGDDIGMPSVDQNIETEHEDDDDENREEINLENERHNDSNAKHDNQVTFSKGRIYLTNITGESTNSFTEEVAEEPDHEESTTTQLALEQYLMKIKNDNIEKRRKMEEEVRNSLKAPSREPFNQFKVPARSRPMKPPQRTDTAYGQTKAKHKKQPLLNIANLPPELADDMTYKPPRRYQPKNAAWITRRLYKYLETKLEPKYDYKARVMSERVVKSMYEFSKQVRRQRVAPPPAVDALKQQLARAGVLRTHYDFYKFFHDFMPREIRVKVVPDVVNEISLPRHGVFSNIII